VREPVLEQPLRGLELVVRCEECSRPVADLQAGLFHGAKQVEAGLYPVEARTHVDPAEHDVARRETPLYGVRWRGRRLGSR
jgi:hypothetical protein